MNHESIDKWIERTILAFVLSTMAFGTLAFGAVRPQDFVVIWWLVIGALGLWMVRTWITPGYRFLWPPLCWSILPFVGYAVWRYHAADIRYLAWQELMHIILAALFL